MKLFYSDTKGRSMIEMLGVLAVVAILSVAGISEFSKAMRKNKYNKIAEDYNMFMQDFLRFKESWIDAKKKTGKDEMFNIAPYLKSMPYFPTTWDVKGDYVYDNTGSYFRPFVRDKTNRLIIDFTLGSNRANELCRFMWLNVVTPQSDSLFYAWVYRGDYGGTESYYGNQHCDDKEFKCIRDMTITEVQKICTACIDEKECIIVLDFD